MTNILTLLAANLGSSPVTVRYPNRPKAAENYRGLVRMDPERCIACGICEYVCVSASITVNRQPDHSDWSYDPGRCTFCGRCVRYCPVEALSQSGEKPPTYSSAGALDVSNRVDYPLCTSCGEPTLPFSETVLTTAFGEITEALRERTHLCKRCRTREAQEAVKTSFSSADRRVTHNGR